MSAGHNGNTLALQLATQCKQRFENIELNYTLAASTFLDIKFKTFHFVRLEMWKPSDPHLQALGRKAASSEPSVSTTSTGTASTVSRQCHKSHLLQTLKGVLTVQHLREDYGRSLTRILAFQANHTANTDAYIQMRRYMEEKVIPRSEDPGEKKN